MLCHHNNSMMIVKASDEPFISVLIRIPKEDLEAFDVVATSRRMSRAALIRECVLEKIASWKGNQEA